MKGDILAVIGAQYGSEGKGNIVRNIAPMYDVHVRVGGPNAGHSFFQYNRLYKMQSIPVGWANPNATLVIGRGALISIEQLYKEWKEIKAVDHTITERLKIDARAGIISPAHHVEAGGVEGEAHKRYGSTGEGVGVARIARIQRYPALFKFANEVMHDLPDDFVDAYAQMLTADTPALLTERADAGQNILLEGTQGSALSLIHGPWPYVTNHDTNAAQLAADCGLPPRLVNRCLLVMRTLPIRVAGNSGPMKGEKTWEEVSAEVGRPVKETTTVTKKTRRVGAWDESLIDRAVQLNAPTSIAINFLDYLAPEDVGKTEGITLSGKSWAFIEYVQGMWHTPVLLCGTGGPEYSVARLRPAHTEWRP